jgi:hypothetical protein
MHVSPRTAASRLPVFACPRSFAGEAKQSDQEAGDPQSYAAIVARTETRPMISPMSRLLAPLDRRAKLRIVTHAAIMRPPICPKYSFSITLAPAPSVALSKSERPLCGKGEYAAPFRLGPEVDVSARVIADPPPRRPEPDPLDMLGSGLAAIAAWRLYGRFDGTQGTPRRPR